MEQTPKSIAWKALQDHANNSLINLRQIDTQTSNLRHYKFTASSSNIHLDYSKQHITSETLNLLFKLSDACNLTAKIKALFEGGIVNISESKPALHTALRNLDNIPIIVNGKNIMPEINAALDKMRIISEKIRNKSWLGFSGKPITDIVNIGIGGSDIGPRFALNALRDFASKELNYHFISDADPDAFKNIIEKLSKETTLFIISSKSFTTQETIYNAKKAFAWIEQKSNFDKHFIAITANVEKARAYGINTIIPIWDFIGGRYSFCSAINLITAIAIGFPQFQQVLEGANSMDNNFKSADYSENLPILLALLGVWNNNFLHVNNLLLLTYTKHLEYFLPFVQQLDMESSGKSIDNKGKNVNHSTGPIVWGGLGNQAQHSYYQLLCQGTHKVAGDFISLTVNDEEFVNEMCRAKINVLTNGFNINNEGNGYIQGNMPINNIRIKNFSPFTIGALVALYEHKIYAISVIWDINPFDQPGVESVKNVYIKENEMFNLIPNSVSTLA